MITFEIFLLGLLVTSTLTALVTEAVKKALTENNVTYRANTLAGIVAIILSAAICAGYIVIAGVGFTAQIVVLLIAQIFASWLCAMVGYDKVVQAISQFKTTNGGDNNE